MQPPPAPLKAVRFGFFEVNLDTGELRKRGRKITLQEQPFKVLALLLLRPGEVVTREELQRSLWPADTFVDFDESLNKAIQKLRQALEDSAERPRYVETVPRRGYRFVAIVEPPNGAQPEQAAGKPGESPAPPGRETRLHGWRIALIATLVVSAGTILAMWLSRPGSAPRVPVRRLALAPAGVTSEPAISPDGRHIAYVAGEGSQRQLWIQDLDRTEPRVIPESDGAQLPFWSPDSESVAFAAGGELRRAGGETGEAPAVCSLPPEMFLGGGWSPDGESIVFSIGKKGIYEVPVRGGPPRLIVKVDTGPGKGDHFDNPSMLPMPDGSRVLLFASQQLPVRHEIEVHSLKTGQRKVVVSQDAVFPVYSPTGHILYTKAHSGWLQAVPFSLATLAVAGEPVTIARIGEYPSVARDGTLAYLKPEGSWLNQLTWRDRNGNKVGTVGEAQSEINFFAISPDGRSVAASARAESSIWVHHTARDGTTQLSFPSAISHPIWLPGGKEITFQIRRRGSLEISLIPADGGGEAKPLVRVPLPGQVWDWSRDGRFLVYEVEEDPKNGPDLWYLKKKEGGGYEPVPFLQTPFTETKAAFSPDGRFLAYVSNESGREEVYARGFPDGEGKRQVSFNGGDQPCWRGDGKELFYVEQDALIAVPVTTTPGFPLGPAKPLFQNPDLTPGDFGGLYRQRYAVSPDGLRFLIAERAGDPPKPVIRVVENWLGEFRRRTPDAR